MWELVGGKMKWEEVVRYEIDCVLDYKKGYSF
jgi:hypothetical protein